MFKIFIKDERGATAIEYGLICALLFLVCVTAFYAFGDAMGEMYGKIETATSNVM